MLTVIPQSPAMAAAFAQIEREFSAAKSLKDRCRRVLREPDHPAIGIRYGYRARLLACLPLNVAIVRVSQWLRIETRAFEIACAYGRGSRLGVMVLEELMLIMRWMRRKNMTGSFATIAAEIRERAA